MDATTLGDGRPPVEIDELDARILDLLRGDARLSARAVAKSVGRSPGAVLERISRLEREGVIRGYSATVDPERIGMGMLAIVGVQAAHDFSLAAMIDHLLRVPECERIFVVTGAWDLLVHLQVRDQHHLAEVIFGEVWKAAGFRHSETMICLQQRAPAAARPLSRGAIEPDLEEAADDGTPTGR
ncbi:MAG: Lrp/AsnC family transcriptional regulator [Chloroflexi bacterium]|nr:Lrp/AsnC family transcriptional regulator [Chloroflexota bacterium]